jgi:hypothetical protein
MRHNFEHRSQDERQGLAEQLEDFWQQATAERREETEQAKRQGSFSDSQ